MAALRRAFRVHSAYRIPVFSNYCYFNTKPTFFAAKRTKIATDEEIEEFLFPTEHRGIFINKCHEHLLSSKHLKINKDKIHKIHINDQYKSLATDELSLFIYEKIPPLKYNNPDVLIHCTRDESKQCEVKVTLSSGEDIILSTEGKTAEQIYSDFCDIVCEKA